MTANNSTASAAGGPPQSVITAVTIFIAFLYVFLILIPVGNGMVVYLVCARKRLHTITNWMVVSLAVSDLAVGLVIIPSRIACLYYKCDEVFLKILYDLFVFASLCNICILTVDRFIAIMHPLKYYTIMTLKVAVRLIAASWLVPIVLLSIRMVWQYGYPDNPQLRQQADKIFYVTQIILFMFVPCLIMLVAYIFIFREAMKQSRRIHHLNQAVRHASHGTPTRGPRALRRGGNSDAKHAVKVFGLVYLLFLLCWCLSAYRTIVFYFYNERGAIDDPITIFSRLMLLFNSCANPIIYALLKKDLRSELKKCCGCGRRGQLEIQGNRSSTVDRDMVKVAQMNEISSSSDSGQKEQNPKHASRDELVGPTPIPEQGSEQHET